MLVNNTLFELIYEIPPPKELLLPSVIVFFCLLVSYPCYFIIIGRPYVICWPAFALYSTCVYGTLEPFQPIKWIYDMLKLLQYLSRFMYIANAYGES